MVVVVVVAGTPIGRAAGPTVDRRASLVLLVPSPSDDERSRSGGGAASVSCGAGMGALTVRSSIVVSEEDVIISPLAGVGMISPESVSMTPRIADPRLVILRETSLRARGVCWFLIVAPALAF